MSFILGLVIGAVLVIIASKVITARKNSVDDGTQPWWTVIGVWPESKERYTLHVQADNARAAEDLTQWEAKDTGSNLWVVGVFSGKIDNADGYAKFVDPDVKSTDWLNTEKGKI